MWSLGRRFWRVQPVTMVVLHLPWGVSGEAAVGPIGMSLAAAGRAQSGEVGWHGGRANGAAREGGRDRGCPSLGPARFGPARARTRNPGLSTSRGHGSTGRGGVPHGGEAASNSWCCSCVIASFVPLSD